MFGTKDWASELATNEKRFKERKLRPYSIGLYGKGGLGKSSFAAHFKDAVFLTDKMERNNLDALVKNNKIPHVGLLTADNWLEVVAAAEYIRDAEKFQTIVIDTGDGVADLCCQHATMVEYEGSRKSFEGFNNSKSAIPYWQDLLRALDECRETGMTVIILFHRERRAEKDPTVADYTQYVPAMNKWLFAATQGWLDMLLYMDDAITDERVIRTYGQGYEAKVRGLSLPHAISMGSSAKEAFTNFSAEVAKAQSESSQAKE